MKHQIEYAAINEQVENDDEFNSLLDISINHKIPHLHECGGHGNCTTCRVRILDGIYNCSPKTELEKKRFFYSKMGSVYSIGLSNVS